MKLKDQNGKEFKTYNVAKDDYPELEGKIVDYEGGMNRRKGLVVGCNKSVGITIVDVEDKNHYLLCITGDASPGGANWREDYHEGVVEFAIKSIMKGEVVSDDIEAFQINRCAGYGPTGSDCAYGQ